MSGDPSAKRERDRKQMPKLRWLGLALVVGAAVAVPAAWLGKLAISEDLAEFVLFGLPVGIYLVLRGFFGFDLAAWFQGLFAREKA